MGSYAYKKARRLIPDYITEAIPNYDGDANYDGDLWIAAANYIEHLHGLIDNLNSKLTEEQRETY